MGELKEAKELARWLHNLPDESVVPANATQYWRAGYLFSRVIDRQQAALDACEAYFESATHNENCDSRLYYPGKSWGDECAGNGWGDCDCGLGKAREALALARIEAAQDALVEGQDK